MGNRKEERNGGCSCILRFVNFTECRIKLHSESSYGLSIQGHICPGAIVDIEVVTIKTNSCVFTYGLKRC